MNLFEMIVFLLSLIILVLNSCLKNLLGLLLSLSFKKTTEQPNLDTATVVLMISSILQLFKS